MAGGSDGNGGQSWEKKGEKSEWEEAYAIEGYGVVGIAAPSQVLVGANDGHDLSVGVGGGEEDGIGAELVAGLAAIALRNNCASCRKEKKYG